MRHADRDGDRAGVETGDRARLRTQTATSSLGVVLGVAGADEDDLYEAMDWALARKDGIETALAARHLANGTLVLYDVSSAAFEGHTCPLGRSDTPATASRVGARSSMGCCAHRPGSGRDRGV
ncbi:putative transposase [Mycobacterium xenopi 3993]|nr:putative transposase [Mycobacterium xenopi 3993]